MEPTDELKTALATPGSKEWWIVRRVATADVRNPWYGLSDEERDAISTRLADYDRARQAEDHYLNQVVGLMAVMRWAGQSLIAAADAANFKDVPRPPPPPPEITP